jgi:hypothetical protein
MQKYILYYKRMHFVNYETITPYDLLHIFLKQKLSILEDAPFFFIPILVLLFIDLSI